MSQPLRVALAGYGLAGEVFHAPLIAATPGLRITTIATGDPERAERARTAHPTARVVPDIREHLGDHDLLVVAAANRAHADLAHAGLHAGLHVVVDKPMAITAAAARALCDHADRAERLLVPFQNRRWDAEFLTLRRLIDTGALGRVFRIESRFCRWRPRPRAGFWRESGDPVDGGGLLLDLGTHLVDQAVALLGAPSHVRAEIAVRRPGATVEDDVFLALGYPRGVHVHIWASAVAADPGPRLRALGTAGAYVRQRLDGQEDALRAGIHPTAGVPWDAEGGGRDGELVRGEQRTAVPSVPGAWPSFYAAMVNAIRHGSPAPVAARDAVLVLEILEEARTSAS